MPKPTKAKKNLNDDKAVGGPGKGGEPNNSTTGAPRSTYEEAQDDEIEVLKAIYDENFSSVESKSAWSKTTEKAFKLKLAAYSDETVNVTLLVTLTATYPKTMPILTLHENSKLDENCSTRVHELVTSLPKQLLGEVMIHELSTSIQDALEDYATAQVQRQARGALIPSLEEERVSKEAMTAKLAMESKENLAKREAAAQAEGERKAREVVEEEMKKRMEARMNRQSETSELSGANQAACVLPTVTFDQQVTLRNDEGHETGFRTVSLIPSTSCGTISALSLAIPATSLHQKPPLMIIKQVAIPHSQAKGSMLELESLLEKLKTVHYSSIINLLEFHVEDDGSHWKFDILVERASQGSLSDMLEITESLPPSKVRLWGIDLLQGIDFLHRNGVVHGRIHPGNVLFHLSSSGVIAPKLADGGFEECLHNLLPRNSKKRSKLASRWIAPELSVDKATETSRKIDIWDFGVVLVQMVLGIRICEIYPSPDRFRESVELSDPFDDLLRDVLHRDPKARPNAFDVTPYEFFRVDGPALQTTTHTERNTRSDTATNPMPTPQRLRHESSGASTFSSRYSTEWDEVARLGKGGYGEVVKSRNKLDGRIYAIKKIAHNTPTELSQVLSEVYLLATLNHPYVVRYYTAWPEEEAGNTVSNLQGLTSSSSAAFTDMVDGSTSISFGQSARGLDFISSSGYPKIEFGYDSAEDEDEDEDEETGEETSDESDSNEDTSSVLDSVQDNMEEMKKSSLAARSRRRSSRPAIRSTLYIQMELCERLTLRDIIRKGLPSNNEEIWRLFRAILEGLVHIHSHGIIHRDLKPENIFIDAAKSPRIGDFGLATSGNFAKPDRIVQSLENDGDMTNNVGTTFYVAPELQTKGTGHYTDKIDMYSLGIIFFEMCYPLSTGMERMHVLTDVRQKDFTLPSTFDTQDKVSLGVIIKDLLSHRPSSRPSSAELLRSGRVPVQVEDETVLLALKGLADESNPYHHKMMAALFAKGPERNIRAQMWDFSDKEAAQSPSIEFSLLQGFVKDKMAACFRRHGAVETSREGPFPQSEYYETKDTFQILDASGTLVQLPYDLTLPFARKIARQAKVPERSFAFGTVWRDALNNGAPRSTREVDFDIVTFNAKDNVLKEAEVIKVMDEVIDEIPALESAPMCFHVSHSRLLDHILTFCRVAEQQKGIVKETLVRLNIQSWTWQKIRTELRSASIGIPATSLDELARFDFRDTPEKTLNRLQAIFSGTTELEWLHDVFTHISGLIEYCKRLGVREKIYISPLSNFNERFYAGGIMFQCLFDAKKRDVLAAGGRYDSLIAAHRPHLAEADKLQKAYAVGINIAWDRIVTSMVRYQSKSKSGSNFLRKGEDTDPETWTLRRCDVLVASFDSMILRSSGVRLVAELWANGISAELASDANTLEEVLSDHRSDGHSWIVQIKHEPGGTSNLNARPDLKVKSVDKKEDFDIRSTELIPFLRAELRERDQREGTDGRHRLTRLQSYTDPTTSTSADVHVLIANHKSKKTNKMRVVESARDAARQLLNESAGAPILAIETRDEVLEGIRDTKLSDAESWRRLVQEVPLTDRLYVGDVQKKIERMNTQYGDTSRMCFVYNFRTGKCIQYDMRL